MSLVAPVDVVVAVPPGTRRPEALLDAVSEQHPDWDVRAVWAGDPQLRPTLTGPHRWLRSSVPEIDLLRVEPDGLPWLVALGIVADRGPERPTVVIVAGAAVLGDLSALVGAPGELVVVPTLTEPPPLSDRHPTFEHLAVTGAVSSCAAGFGPGSDAVVRWIRDGLVVPHDRFRDVDAGRVLELAASFFPSRRCGDDRIGASVWRWPARTPSLLDLPEFDAGRHWLADPTLSGPPRVSLGTPERMSAVNRAAAQLAGTTEPLRLPGGIEVDRVVRRLARRHADAPSQPWSDSAAFRDWLDEEYWNEVHAGRPDLQQTFPYFQGADADRFAAWARRAAADGDAPWLIDPSRLRTSSSSIRRTGERRDGVNLVGYFRHQSGVANVGRRVAEILGRQGVPYSTVAWERTWNPPIVPQPVTDQTFDFADSIAFVNGDQFSHLYHDLPQMFGEGRQVAGMWFWELETIEGGPRLGHAHADQIWAMTEFSAAPYRGLGPPVERIYVPFDRPARSSRRRSEFAPLADADDRFVFGVVLDHLSVTERKNPMGAIRAFRRAFEPSSDGTGPMLVVKTINGGVAWRGHERLLVEAAGRDDIVVWDEMLPIADHVALIASFDALVSLHRSEGAGLHLAEAMWFERPVIATGYSGNLDFMDDRSAILVDHSMVPVGPGLDPYPPDALWADPDLDQAADAMRRLVADPALVHRIGVAGREKMESMPGEEEFARRVVELLDLDVDLDVVGPEVGGSEVGGPAQNS